MSASRAKTKQQIISPSDKIKKTSSPRPLPGLSFEEPPTSSEMTKLLKELTEREQDLELAANLGNSLLQENKELIEKNEFLEESLATSNETISQLQKHLKQRSKLFRTIVDLENEYNEEEAIENACCSSISCSRSVDFSQMEKKLSNLEKKNNQLRIQVDDLGEQKILIEKRERNTVSDYMSQLRGANLKIAQIQVQLGDKTKQCESQTEEIQRLLADISERKRRERILWDENEDIQTRLDEALHNHEQLRSEMEQLQERHLDLVVMLRDTEDELIEHRRRAEAPPPSQIRRTNSVDSLYDSLASELEGADSGGCYGTPMFSARYGPSKHCSSLDSGGVINQQLPSQPSTSSALFDSQPLPEIEVPSRALLEAVRRNLDDRKFQITSKQKRKISKEEEKEFQLSVDSPSTPIIDCNILVNNNRQQIQRKTFQDACCSPIQLSPGKSSSLWKFSTPQNSKNVKNNKNKLSPQISSGSSTESIDSISNYYSPELGTPGEPGSRDLDISIRRLSVRKEINEKYARFRNSKGLPPAQNEFYSPNEKKNYQFIFQSSFQSSCPTKQLKLLCLDSTNNNSPIISKSSPECSRFSFRPIKQKGEKNKFIEENIKTSFYNLSSVTSSLCTTNNSGIFSLVNLVGRNNNNGKNKTIISSESYSSGLEYYGKNSKQNKEHNLFIKNCINSEENTPKISNSVKNVQKKLFNQQKTNESGIENLLKLNSSCSNLSVITAIETQQSQQQIGGGVIQRYGKR